MKHKLLYLFTLLFLATSLGWGQNNSLQSSDLTFKGTDEDVNLFKTSMGITKGSWVIIYGNGFPMTIEKTANAASDNQITVTFDGQEAPDPISLTGEEKAIIFGGSKDVDLNDNTSITLKSGNVGYIIGGGWGTKGRTATDPKTANVKNVSIDIQNGSVGLIYSGGLYRANVDDINLNIRNAVIDYIYCGGFDQGETSNTIETEWDNSVNHVSSSTLNMDNSTVNGYLFLGGGQGYSYSKEVKATISKSKLCGGILGTGSNGRSNKVIATVSECTFEKITNGDIIEIAPINRGYVKEVEMTFNGCIFPTSLDDYKSYLGATYCYDGKSKAEVDKVGLHFVNCTNTPKMWLSHGLENADVTLTGTQAVVGTTYESSSKTLNTYTIATGKKWILEGIRYDGEATLTNNGSLSITCPTVEDLVAAVKAKANTITLDAGTYSLTSQLVIGNSLKITGNDKTKTIITADKSWTGGEDAQDLIKVAVTNEVATTYSLLKNDNDATNDVTLSKLTISGAKGNGLVATTPVSLADVALTNNAEAGLMVAATTVTATNLTTSGNGESGVNVEQGEVGTSGSTNFTFDETSFFYEDNKIKADAKDLVTVPDNSPWAPVEGEGDSYIYTTAPSITTETLSPFPGKKNWTGTYTFVYANGKPITITQSEAGKVKISVNGTNEYVELLESANPVIFGGSKDKTVKSSTITMNNGTIFMLLGGGYGTIETDKTSEKHAGVTGSTNISINGGKITNSLFGGGLYYNHSKDVTIDIKGNLTVGQWLICGGFESGVTSGGNYPDFDKSNNTVESAKLTINGGTYGYIAVGGTDGAKGYIKESNATIKNAKASGLYANGSNGRSDKVSIVAENCTFEKLGNGPVEIASLNRGNTTHVDITFTDCTFPENESDAYVYLGATYNTLLNYNGSEYGIKPDKDGNASVKFTFKGGTNVPKVGVSDGLKDADVTLNGAIGYVAPFSKDNTNSIKDFSIAEGKTWTFDNGLEIVKADDEDKQATLTYSANATGSTKAGTLTVGGTMTPAKEDDVTAALKGDNPSASAFDVTNLEGWTSDKLAEKLNEKFYAENVIEGKRTEPFSGIKFICKDDGNTVIVFSDKDAANTDANPDAKYLIWDDTAKKYKTGEGSIETKSPITLTIKISNASDVISVKVNGEDATKEADGTYKVYAGQKLSVKFKTKSNYSVSAQINNTQYTNESEYTVPADVDKLEMKITYTYNPVPDDPTPTPDPEPSEDVKLSFDTTEKTVKVGDEFTLKVTVTGAESSRIVWTSSDSNVATVTSDGKVKAVGTGTATITARIGDVEAVCALTVEDEPTGIEAISAGTQLYAVSGQIVILPAEPVQVTVHAVTGVCIYTGRISETLYIPAPAGVYLVTLSTGKGEVTEKVNVR